MSCHNTLSNKVFCFQANQTRASLEEILDQMKEFIDNSQRSSPEQIRALAEEITMAKISLTPAQIEELANQVVAVILTR